MKYRVFRNSVGRLESYHLFKFLAESAYKRFFAPKEAIEAARLAALGEIPKNPFNEVESPDAKIDRVIGKKSQRELFRAILKETRKEVVEKDHTQWLNTIVSADVREKVPEFEWYMQWVENEFNSIGIESINFHSKFRERYLQTGELPHFLMDTHWNETGQERVAESLLNYIQKQTK